MNIHPSDRHPHLRPGLSVIELTVVISVLLALGSLLFLGVQAWKSGSDRAACVLNIYTHQTAVRSYCNLNGLSAGQALRKSRDLRRELVGAGRFVQAAPECPGGGDYRDLGNRIPDSGELYLSCSLAEDERHMPRRFDTW